MAWEEILRALNLLNSEKTEKRSAKRLQRENRVANCPSCQISMKNHHGLFCSMKDVEQLSISLLI